MATTSFPPLIIKRTFLASTCSVFNAWVSPFVLEQWLFRNHTNRVEFRGKVAEGSRFSIMETDQGNEIDHSGVYTSAKINKELAFSLSVPKHFDGESNVELQFNDNGFGCEMIFTQTNIDTGKTAAAWEEMFDRLGDTLQKPYVITDTSPAEDILTAIEVVVMQIAGLSRPFNDEDINRTPAIGGWSMGKLLNHVQKYMTLVSVFAQPGKTVTRDPAANAVHFRQTFLDQTLKMSSPEMIVPDEKRFVSAEIYDDFTRSLRELRSQALETDLNAELSGLPMGPVTKLELLLFTLYHSQRHLWQMAKIADVVRAK